MRKSRFTDSQIMAALKRAEAGEAVPALCRPLMLAQGGEVPRLREFGRRSLALEEE